MLFSDFCFFEHDFFFGKNVSFFTVSIKSRQFIWFNSHPTMSCPNLVFLHSHQSFIILLKVINTANYQNSTNLLMHLSWTLNLFWSGVFIPFVCYEFSSMEGGGGVLGSFYSVNKFMVAHGEYIGFTSKTSEKNNIF